MKTSLDRGSAESSHLRARRLPLIRFAWAMFVGVVALPRPSITAAAQSLPHVWQRWEHALTSTRTYTNACLDVTLRVTYTGPGDRKLRTYGFWDGGNVFRIRCAFPTPGAWRWETDCSDTPMRPAPSARLGRGGVLFGQQPAVPARVSESKRQPSLPGLRRRCALSVDGRHGLGGAAPGQRRGMGGVPQGSRGQTLHARSGGAVPAMAGERNRRGERPFTDKTCSQWNPAYWQTYERKIERANEQGVVVLMVGLMEPVHRYPETVYAQRFARNIIARLFGNFVIFSPSFDSDFTPLANEVGRAARDATAVHLLTSTPARLGARPRDHHRPLLRRTLPRYCRRPKWAQCRQARLVRAPCHRVAAASLPAQAAQTGDQYRSHVRRAGHKRLAGNGRPFSRLAQLVVGRARLHLRGRRYAAQGSQGNGAVWKWVTTREIRLLGEGPPVGQRLPDAAPARLPGGHRMVAP